MSMPHSLPSQTSSPLTEPTRRGDLMAATCPSREVLKHVTSRWGILALIALEGRTRRFGEIRRAIGGVSERMLARTLQWLEGDGLIDRVALEVVPPHVEYSLTPLGREATEKVRALADWIESNLPVIACRWDRSRQRGRSRAGVDRPLQKKPTRRNPPRART